MERYIYSSAAPKYVPETPVRQPKRREELTREEVKKQQKKAQIEYNRSRATSFGALFTLFVVAAMAVVLFTCSNYISKINETAANRKTIEKLRDEVSELKQNNDLLELSIDTSIDYDYIYNIATKELGMTYPKDGQIVRYPSKESQYVIQFSDIPEY